MTDSNDDINMTLGSGIAAFEAKHFARATELLSALAEDGEPEAQYRMAIMAQNGLGMVANELLAFKYMRAAAEQGHADAKYELGFLYSQGLGVTQDHFAAAKWYHSAARQGHAEAGGAAARRGD